jgi:hypothetical protein
MTESDMAIRAANVALANRIMADFGRDMRHWYDNLHDDMVLEFPYGASVGMPTRIEGKTACSRLFAANLHGRPGAVPRCAGSSDAGSQPPARGVPRL